jgi:Smg protein
MLEVLIYLFENYYTPESCPDSDALARKLAAVGFENEEIDEALDWLSGLSHAVSTPPQHAVAEAPSGTAHSWRYYTEQESQHLGADALGFLSFLDSAGVLSTIHRELIIERALALNETPVSIEAMKVIVLMVLWSQEAEVDALILEELLDDGSPRTIH